MKLKMTSSRNDFQAIMPISIREQIRTHSTNTWAISMPQITYECAYKMTFEKKLFIMVVPLNMVMDKK